jgi:hypothetical protein
MNKKLYTAILDDIARGYIPDHIDLAPRILSQLEKRKHTPMNLRLKTLVATMVALLMIVAMLTRVPSIAEAMHQILSRFIPGIGIIETSEARVLAMPVTVTRDGITVTVEQLVADQQRTTLVYRVEGLPNLSQSIHEEAYTCSGEPVLRLPTGAQVLLSASEPSMDVSAQGDGVFHVTYRFPNLPVNVGDITFVIPCLLQGSTIGILPENWEIA